MYYTIMKTHMCDIILAGDENGLSHLHLDTSKGKRVFEIENDWIYNNEFFKETIAQINAYFHGKLKNFNIKLNPAGTEYQKKVWVELSKIPFNEICTYKDIAVRIGNPKASRAIGMANSKNPIPLIVPCHRVIGSNGKLTGFAHGLEIKEKLIRFEKISTAYNMLLGYYGDLNWWPADSDYEMMVGAVLTQNTTWENAAKAIANLGEKLLPEKIMEMETDELAELIKPSGYYNQKALKIKALTLWFQSYDFKIESAMEIEAAVLRKELLNVNGIGKETADCILTYSLKKPYFVIDTYTRRFFKRFGFGVPADYDEFRTMIESVLKKDVDIYNRYHAMIVEHSKQFCTKVPVCDGCPLYELCEKNI